MSLLHNCITLVHSLEGFRAADHDPCIWELVNDLGWDRPMVSWTISDSRSRYLPELERAIACSYDKHHTCAYVHDYGAYVYRLTELYADVSHPSIRRWIQRRFKSIETQLANVLRAGQVAVKFTDHRTILGRKARAVVKGVGRLLEDLHDIDTDGTAEAG
jgi:hypothetical protein